MALSAVQLMFPNVHCQCGCPSSFTREHCMVALLVLGISEDGSEYKCSQHLGIGGKLMCEVIKTVQVALAECIKFEAECFMVSCKNSFVGYSFFSFNLPK